MENAIIGIGIIGVVLVAWLIFWMDGGNVSVNDAYTGDDIDDDDGDNSDKL